MKQFISLLFVLSCFTLTTTAQSITTYPYAQRDTGYLQLDFYTPESPKEGNPLIVYIFGGGFSVGERNSNQNMNNCKLYQQEGYYVAAIDYRLGIKGINKFTPQTVENAIKYGVEDCVDAINFLYNNAEKLNINTSQIYLLGSSAGAIISLQTDYFRANNHEITAHLPNNFTFAGIISYSGAIYSHHGKPKYKGHNPAPTLFLHGTADRIVNYKKIQIFNLGMFGTKSNVKQFHKYKFPYHVRRYPEMGHEVSDYMSITIPMVNEFIQTYGMQKQALYIDETFQSDSIQPTAFSKVSIFNFPKYMKRYEKEIEAKKKAEQQANTEK